MLRDAHAPDEHGVLRVANQLGEFLHRHAVETGLAFECDEVERLDGFLELIEVGGVFLDEGVIHPAFRDEDFHHAVEERDVAALRDGEPVVRDVGAEERAAHAARHPVTLHARLAIGIHHHDARAGLLGFVQILGGDGLVVRGIRAEEDDEVRAPPIAVAARGGRDADGVFHRAGAGAVAETRGVIDVVRAEEARGFLRHVIDFVGDAARGDEEPDALWVAGFDALRHALIRFVPTDSPEADIAMLAQHGVGDAAQLAQLRIVRLLEE